MDEAPLTAEEAAEAAEYAMQAKIDAAAMHKAASFMLKRDDSKKQVEQRPPRAHDEISPRLAILMGAAPPPPKAPPFKKKVSSKEALPSLPPREPASPANKPSSKPASRSPSPASPARKASPSKQQPAGLEGELKGESDYGFIMRLKPVFQHLDVNGSGTIDAHELRKVVRAMHVEISDAQAEAMVKVADTNGTGELEFDEFAVIMRRQVVEGSSAWGPAVPPGLFGGLFGGGEDGSKSEAAPAAFTEASLKEFKSLARAASGVRGTPRSPPSTPKSSASKSPPPNRQSSPTVQVAPPPAKAPAQPPSSESDLRLKLRPVFDKFDVDHSGSVSTAEMGAMLTQIGMQKTPRELKKLMVEADPDGSGEIDFDEFVTVLNKQMKDGGGGLFSVFAGASSLFGFVNPLSWFSSKEDPEPPPPGPRSPVVAYGGGRWPARFAPWSPPPPGGRRLNGGEVDSVTV